ncbi:cystatin C (amyloid angiopathy and cerebral hemorrhage) [Trachinotus anak]|uniref:cystatin C (amyloid angiopathy and cerebral hemorrhage) n=1 Tax=Trachinotus anak TaxID=443729 RepID=UPI0039F253C2
MWKLVLPVLAAVFAVGLGSLVGGARDIDSNEQGAQEALNFAVVEHNKKTNDLFLRKVAEVVKVQRQVVAGSKYIITVKMAKTTCRKGGADEACDFHQDPALAQPYECTFTVWSRPWIDDIRLLSEKC